MNAPHRMVGEVADGLVGGVRGIGNGLVGGVKGAGSSIMNALDKPFTAATGKQGPHRILDRLANGLLDAGVNAVDSGIVGSVQKAGQGIMHALDQPIEQLGDMGKFQMPKFKR